MKSVLLFFSIIILGTVVLGLETGNWDPFRRTSTVLGIAAMIGWIAAESKEESS